LVRSVARQPARDNGLLVLVLVSKQARALRPSGNAPYTAALWTNHLLSSGCESPMLAQIKLDHYRMLGACLHVNVRDGAARQGRLPICTILDM
jgi:hypothetical protein